VTPVTPAVTTTPAGSAAAPVTARIYSADNAGLRPFLPRIIDAIIDKVRGILSESMFDTIAKFALLGGELLMYPALLVMMIVYIITAIRGDSVQPVFEGIGVFVVGVLALYVVLQLIAAGFRMLRTNPSRVASRIYLNCFVVFFLVAGFYFLTRPILSYYDLKDRGPALWNSFAQWWTLAVPAFAGAILALNPKILNIEIDPEATAGETFLGLVSFALKMALALLPIYLMMGAVLVAYASIVSASYYLFSTDKGLGNMYGYRALVQARGYLYDTLKWPIYVTLAFLAYYLVVDLCDAILSLRRPRGIGEGRA
jgi:hypothetical protein